MAPRLRYLCGLIFFIAFLLRMEGISQRSLWLDEFKSLSSARSSPVQIIKERAIRGHLPAYFFLLHFNREILGETHWALRFPSLVFSLLTIYFVLLISTRLFKTNYWSVLPAALIAIHSMDIYNAQNARMYSLLSMLTASSWYFYLCLAQEKDKSRRVYFINLTLYFIFNLIGILTHPVYFFVIIGQFIISIVKGGGNKISRKLFWTQIFLLCFQLLILFLLAQRQQTLALGRESGFVSPKKMLTRLTEITFGFYDSLGYETAAKYVGFILLLIIAYLSLRYILAKINASGEKQWWLWIGAFPIFVVLYFGSWIDYKLIASARYYTPSLVLMPLLITAGAVEIQKKSWRALFVGIISLFTLQGTVGYVLSPDDGVKTAINYIAYNHSQDDAVIICSDSEANKLAFDYYTKGKIKVYGINREIATAEEIRQNVHPWLEGKERVWLFLYHQSKSPIASVLSNWEEKLIKKEKKDFNKVKVYLFKIR